MELINKENETVKYFVGMFHRERYEIFGVKLTIIVTIKTTIYTQNSIF